MSFQFRGQRPNENIVLLVRQHPVYLAETLFVDILILLVPWIFFVFVAFGTVFWYVFVLSLVVAGLRFGLAWYKWYNTVMLLSNERVIALKQRGLAHREISECTLDGIQQINHKVKGILGTIFGYGDMEIVLSGSQHPFIIHNVPDPYEIQQEVLLAAKGETGSEGE